MRDRAQARRFQETVARTCEPPVQTLINTHHHADHTFGNFVAPPHATIVAHRKARDEVIATGTSIAAAFEGPDWGDIEIVPPFLCFEDRLTLFVDDLECQLIHFGTPAHTTNDIVVWIPEHKVLFSGDLAFKGGTPFALQGSVDGWLETLERLSALGAETVVPGHGPVCGPEVFDEARRYLQFLKETAQRGYEAGLEPLELARETDLGEFAELSDAERIVGNSTGRTRSCGARSEASPSTCRRSSERCAYIRGPSLPTPDTRSVGRTRLVLRRYRPTEW